MRAFLFTSVLVAFIALNQIQTVEGHGMLIDPPGRSSMWRAGFPVPPNYNDNELNCGGFYETV